MHPTREVLAYDVELDIHHCTRLNLAEVGVIVSIGYDGYLERIVGGITYGKAHAIDCNRTLIDSEVTTLRHLAIELILKGIVPTTVGLYYLATTRCLIDMALYNVTIKTTIHHHTTLKIYQVANLEQAQV